MGLFKNRDDFDVRVTYVNQAGKTHFCEVRVTGPDLPPFSVNAQGSSGVDALKNATNRARTQVAKIRKVQANQAADRERKEAKKRGKKR